jgi:hypothetical protein
MEGQEYIFLPAGEQPTKDNLRGNFIKSIAMVAVICSFASWFETYDHQIYFLIAFIVIGLILYLMTLSTKFIRCIKIDPHKKLLYLEYITYHGIEGVSVFDLVHAKTKYAYKPSRGMQGYLLTILDEKSKLEIMETKVRNGKDQKNGFLRDQIDQMHEIILSIQSIR